MRGRFAAVLSLSILAPSALAERQEELRCWSPMSLTVGGNSFSIPPTDRSSGMTWADQAVDQTAVSTTTQSWGFEFASPGDTTEIQCTWIVPDDYADSESTVPEVTLMGWATGTNLCGTGNNATKYSRFSVSSRALAPGESASAAWSTAVTGDFSFACENCGFADCRLGDKVKSVSIDAAQTSSAWEPGDVVFIRIQRVSVNDDFDQTVHVARVRLSFPE